MRSRLIQHLCFLFVLWLALLQGNAWALAENEDQEINRRDFVIQSRSFVQTLLNISYQSSQQKSLLNGSRWSYQGDPEHESCQQRYNKIFADGEMNINISFGYADSGGHTFDQDLFHATYSALTRKCEHNWDFVCGFTDATGITLNSFLNLVQESNVKLFRYISVPNKEGEIQQKLVNINLSYSSEDADDDMANFDNGRPKQRQNELTRQSENNFFGSIAGTYWKPCDICIYWGHARNGGGPDFSPVPLGWRKSNGKPNYDFYEAQRTNYKKLLLAMKKAEADPPSMVALFACYSHTHFYEYKTCINEVDPECVKKSLADYSDKTAMLLTSKFSYFQNWEKNLGTLLDNVLGLKCQSQIQENFESIVTDPNRPEHFKLYGTF